MSREMVLTDTPPQGQDKLLKGFHSVLYSNCYFSLTADSRTSFWPLKGSSWWCKGSGFAYLF